MDERICLNRPSQSERMQIVHAYVYGKKPAQLFAEDYGISPRTFARWVKEYKEICINPKKVIPLPSETDTPSSTMEYATPQDEIAALKEALEKERQEHQITKNKVVALDRMIDIAETQGIRIRKNSGAKQ